MHYAPLSILGWQSMGEPTGKVLFMEDIPKQLVGHQYLMTGGLWFVADVHFWPMVRKWFAIFRRFWNWFSKGLEDACLMNLVCYTEMRYHQGIEDIGAARCPQGSHHWECLLNWNHHLWIGRQSQPSHNQMPPTFFVCIRLGARFWPTDLFVLSLHALRICMDHIFVHAKRRLDMWSEEQ